MPIIPTLFNYLKMNEYVIVYIDLSILLLKPLLADKKKNSAAAVYTFNV